MLVKQAKELIGLRPTPLSSLAVGMKVFRAADTIQRTAGCSKRVNQRDPKEQTLGNECEEAERLRTSWPPISAYCQEA